MKINFKCKAKIFEMKFYMDGLHKRFYFIDILKFFAIVLIINSHMEPAYGNYAYLASGGAIGLALFFFLLPTFIVFAAIGAVVVFVLRLFM